MLLLSSVEAPAAVVMGGFADSIGTVGEMWPVVKGETGVEIRWECLCVSEVAWK